MNEIYCSAFNTYGNKLYRNKLITNKKPGILVKTSLQSKPLQIYFYFLSRILI